MEQTVIHNLSSRKLFAVFAVSLALFVAFFLVGELATGGLPQTATSTQIAKPCSNVGGSDGWFHSDHCERLGNITYMTYESNPPVFYVVLPRKGDKFTPWNQFLLTTMQLKLGVYNLSNIDVRDRRKPWVNLKVQTNLAHWNGEWRRMVSSEKRIQLLCDIQQENFKNAELQCPEVPHFELDSVQYGYYLINMKLQVELKTQYSHDVQLWIKEVQSKVTYQRAKFTQAFFSLKLIYCPVSLLALVIYLLRAKKYRTQMSTLEKSMVSVVAILAFFNFPIEWLTIWLDIPPMMLLVDVRLVMFYGMLFYFTTHFIREQLKVKPAPLHFKICTFTVKTHVADIGIPIVTFLLILYYLIDRLTILDDHFYCMALKTEGVQALLAFVISVGVWTGLYSLHLTARAAHAIRDIKEKYTGTIEKAWVGAVVANILIVWLTVLYFCISNVHWAYLKYRTTFHVSGALFTGIVGSWNIFVVAFLLLFSPSEAISDNQGSPHTPAIAEENDNADDRAIIDAGTKA